MYRHHDGADDRCDKSFTYSTQLNAEQEAYSYRKETLRPLHNIEIRVLH